MSFNFMAAVTICSDFGAQKIKSATVSPSICHEVMGPDAMILVFQMLSIKPTFSLSSFTFIKRLFSSSLSAVKVVSPAYPRLLIFLPAILIPACASFSQLVITFPGTPFSSLFPQILFFQFAESRCVRYFVLVLHTISIL